jgi:predicted short-subunit dehydrogenase-like oxidoreductase (DUF2520 family)
MNIVIIGSGNVAWNVGKLLKLKGHEIVQVLSTNSSTGSQLAYELDTESTNYWSMLKTNADLYLVAVKDDAIPDVCSRLRLGKALVVHTSGAVPIGVLQGCSERYGLLYPLQSLKFGVATVPEIPFMVDGSNTEVRNTLYNIAQSLGPEPALTNDAQRLEMHIAAVFVNNFANHLYVLAEQWCRKHGLNFAQLHPMIQETVQRLRTTPPAQAQTGPASRKDMDTINRHKAALAGEPQLLKIYEVLTESILKG